HCVRFFCCFTGFLPRCNIALFHWVLPNPLLDSSMSDNTEVTMTESPRSEPDVIFCGFNLSNLSRDARFVVCVVGIFITYLFYGALQEAIFTASKMQSYSAFLTLYQFAIYVILSFVELRSQRRSLRDFQPSDVSMSVYCLLATLSLSTIAFSNASVSFLNYPTQVIFKCCKMIPVMIGGILLLGKRYNWLEVSAVMCMTFGLIFFTLVDVAVQPKFSVIGVILVTVALCSDGALGNAQELAMRKLKATNTEILFYSYAIGFLMLFLCLLLSGNLVPSVYHFIALTARSLSPCLWVYLCILVDAEYYGFTHTCGSNQSADFCAQHPMKTFGYGSIFSICGYFGMHFVLCLVHSHGALTAVTVTTLRKAVSIVISFVLFEKPFAMGYLWSGLLVVCGIYLNLYNKHRAKWDAFIMTHFERRCWGKSNPILPV
ncbi:Adenosine 3'-phospho 5'-phosphosulfate transporter 2, partial [Fasciolopsis buskii]